jgi:hypothetical protein
MNSPQFSKRPRFSFSVAVRSRRATASRFSHAFALDCRTSRCSRIRPAWPRLGFYRSCAVGEAFKGPDIGDVCYRKIILLTFLPHHLDSMTGQIH